ncbi:dehydrogenase [Pseudonocardia sulfidoxydans NBRC 16205]|uniref:Dehydrogenase n=2 Tax=Pseudonocardia sulfidoxydans TaxID=54011 RepID=A0A511DED2_9PSEU|nr:xanthine dehydrogenase family protein molybdopterin-binding subunit [Pseudonocardia sulfidoxydans]GEL23136.1 dehydrogenase [Pseudonocardia sulfidoxydans NBRC 16205]
MTAADTGVPGAGAWALRRGDARLLTGAGAYVGDVVRDGQLWLSVVRSPLAHGRITAVDVTAAAAAPGVRVVLTGADLDRVPRIPIRVVETPRMAARLQPVLATDRVRYVGEPVAAVVADDPYHAEDAAELVDVEIEPLPAVGGPDDVTPMWEDGLDNEIAEFRATNGDVDAAFAGADVVVEADFRVARQSGLPMETRGLVCEWSDGFLHIWGATKFVHFTRRTVAGFFDLDPDRVICHRVDVGGMFGVRGEVYPEDFLVPWAARVTGRPVKWVEDRREHLMTINHSRDHRHRFAIAASRDGRLLAFRSDGTIDVGAYPRPIGARLPQNLAGSFPGPYRWTAFEARCRSVASTKTPSGTMRAPSSAEAIFVMERAVDMVARRLGLDPLELRRRNLVPAADLPLTVDMGDGGVHAATYDSGDYPAQLDEVLRRCGHEAMVDEVARRRAAGEHVGVGHALFVDHSGMGREETVGLELDTSGTFVLGTSATEFGQGLEDMAVRVLADALDVDATDVRVQSGASTAHAGGNGTFASRSTIFVGSAAVHAATQLLEVAESRAATLLSCPATQLVRTPDGYKAGSRSIAWKELAPIETVGRHAMEEPTHGFGIALAVAAVDPGTLAVSVERVVVGYDVGRAIDLPAVHSQLAGGAAMGLGGSLLESLTFDAQGQPLGATFMDYLLPTAAEMPPIDVHVVELGGVPGNPLGVKGAGEAGIKGIGGAVANAVAAALGAPAAQGVTALPIRPDDLAPLLPSPVTPAEPSAAPPARSGSAARRRPAAAVGGVLALVAAGWLARRGRKER